MKAAGSLEAAVLIAKNPQLDQNSMAVGPRIRDEHGITEKVYVSTIKTFFEMLLDVLKEIK
ncbi:MAG: hypothetical protein MJ223_00455 [Mycoplasmoidaceae bacterium]|nr:hypothetical protein [Mycoplasmoidaceae bacterium]